MVELLLLGLGAAALASKKKQEDACTQAPAPQQKPTKGFGIDMGKWFAKTAYGKQVSLCRDGVYSSQGAALVGITDANSVSQSADVGRKVLEEAQKAVEAEYNKLSAQAKKKGAEAVNKALGKLGHDPGLTGEEGFAEAGRKIGGSGFAIGAEKACSYIPYVGAAAAPACGWLGQITGEYLGKELGQFLKKASEKVRDWVKGAAKDVGKWTQTAVKDAGHTVEKAASAVGHWFTSTF